MTNSPRATYQKKAIVAWLQFHRPDVLEAIIKESFEKYPSHVRKSPDFELSARLKSLK